MNDFEMYRQRYETDGVKFHITDTGFMQMEITSERLRHDVAEIASALTAHAFEFGPHRMAHVLVAFLGYIGRALDTSKEEFVSHYQRVIERVGGDFFDIGNAVMEAVGNDEDAEEEGAA